MIKTILLFIIAMMIATIIYGIGAHFTGLAFNFGAWLILLSYVTIVLGVILMIDEYLSKRMEL
jgi:uncharacterized membrane protein